MRVREFTPQQQKISRQVKNVEKYVRLYNATGIEKHINKALKLRQKYIDDANKTRARINPVTITGIHS